MDFTSGLCNETGDVDLRKVVQLFYDRGILLFKDDRLKPFVDALVEVESSHGLGSRAMHTVLKVSVLKEEFESLLTRNPFAMDVLTNSLVIPDFQDFSREVESAFLAEAEERSGEITTYIPGLSKYSLDNWAISFCSADGQVMALGDYKERFTIQSCTKPILYGIACDMVGIDKVHKHVGKEPSGFGFNKIALGHGDKPHNPLINIGAITVASLVRPEENSSERFETCYNKYNALAAGIRTRSLSFNNAVYLSERESGHRNYAIGHYLVNKGCIEGTTSSLTEVLELYFQLCSIEADVRAVSVMGATLANGGKNVFTGERVLSEASTRNMLSLMFSCGMYDYSGHWAFEVGLPAKSGVSGVIMAVLPNVGSFAMWSPPLDSYGNSVRGVNFTRRILESGRGHLRHPFSTHLTRRSYHTRSYHTGSRFSGRETAARAALSLVKMIRK